MKKIRVFSMVLLLVSAITLLFTAVYTTEKAIRIMAIPAILANAVIIVMLFKSADKKMVMIAPIIVAVVVALSLDSMLTTIYYINSLEAETNIETNILDLVIFAGLVVSFVFALKGKKWASIVIFVIMGIFIYNAYSLITNFAESFMDSDITSDSYFLLGAIILIYTSMIVLFSSNFINKNEEVKAIEESTSLE